MRLLLINPWIYDFSAFDLWAKPLGLLYLASVLRQNGAEVSFIDCLDRYHWSLRPKPARDKDFGCGKYPAVEVPKPSALKFVRRRYKRYGITTEAFVRDLQDAGKPDAVLVTSRMTYWYPGVVEAIKICREMLPAAPIILGGTYATLMPEHAKRFSGADLIVGGEAEEQIAPILQQMLNVNVPAPPVSLINLDSLPVPAFDLYKRLSYIAAAVSRGCPYSCSYCAAKILSPSFRRRNPDRAAEELVVLEHKFGVKDIAFYDDALLADAERYFVPFLQKYLALGGKARFHTPNGLDASSIDKSIAAVMKRANFTTLRLSLETTSAEQLHRLRRRSDSLEKLTAAVEALRAAGFSQQQIGVYLLVGFPGQTLQEVKESSEIVLELGATPRLAEYSPIPGTAMWDEALQAVKTLDIANEPLYHNNSVYYRLLPEFSSDPFPALRNYISKQTASTGND